MPDPYNGPPFPDEDDTLNLDNPFDFDDPKVKEAVEEADAIQEARRDQAEDFAEMMQTIAKQEEEIARLRAVVDEARALIRYEVEGQADDFICWDEFFGTLAQAVIDYDAEAKP